MIDCISEINLTDGMKELLEFTEKTKNVEHIIISDANSVFISNILENNGLSSLFTVFTNPAEFDSNGCLTIEPYHCQDWCTLSTVNLCKGHILEEFISQRLAEGVTFHHVIYVGDGFNDLCPGLKLQSSDALMPRRGFSLLKNIEKMDKGDKPVPRTNLKATVISWDNGFDILNYVKSLPFVENL